MKIKETKFTIIITFLFFFLVFLALGGFKFPKWINYVFNCSSKIEEQIIKNINN
jgi:hypothetical protein